MSRRIRTRSRLSAALLLAALCLPAHAIAALEITEIMYDLEGGDSGREWLEVTNTGSSARDLSSYRLLEAGVRHRLKAAQGSMLIPPGGSAVIAEDAELFLIDWPEYSGALLDSAFSLSNSGETLALEDAAGAHARLSYSSELGAKGDGGSLHVTAAGLVPALPTPGIHPGELVPVPSEKQEEETASALFMPAPEKAAGPSIAGYALALLSVIGIGIAGALFARRNPSEEPSPDEFEIIEKTG